MLVCRCWSKWKSVPKPQKIQGSDRVAPFVLLGDDTFGLKGTLIQIWKSFYMFQFI